MAVMDSLLSSALRDALFSKVALVTGAASGIGLAISQLFAAHGATVIMVDLDLERVKTASHNIDSNKTFPYQCDISSWPQQRHLFDCVLTRFFRLDIVCCNAGIDPELVCLSTTAGATATTQVRFNWLADEQDRHDDIEDADADPIPPSQHPRPITRGLKAPPSAIWDVNLAGTIYSIKLAVHHMSLLDKHARTMTTVPPPPPPPSPSRHIILTGSAAAYAGFPGQDLYCASKHALLGLVRATSQRLELAEAGLALSMVCPCLTETDMVANIASRYTEDAPSSQPHDVAIAVAELARGATADSNGRVVVVQGRDVLEVERVRERQWLKDLQNRLH